MWKPDWTRRDRSNLYLVPPEKFDQQEFLTRQLSASAVIYDWREEFLKTVRPTQKLLGVSVRSEIERLQKVCNSGRQVFSIINTEYFLAYFDERMREQFWLSLFYDFPNLTGFIIFTVFDTPTLAPDKLVLEEWQKDGRLFRAQ
jgi:hypothetical protein